jgi:hypothetical protein
VSLTADTKVTPNARVPVGDGTVGTTLAEGEDDTKTTARDGAAPRSERSKRRG